MVLNSSKIHLLKDTTFGSLFLSRLVGLICFLPQIPLLDLPKYFTSENLKILEKPKIDFDLSD